MNLINKIKKGQIWWADLGQQEGSIQSGKRPVLVLQNDIGNKYSPVVTICPISSRIEKMKLPTHVKLNKNCGLIRESFALIEQIQTMNKNSLLGYIGNINEITMKKINIACKIQLGIMDQFDIQSFIKICRLKNKSDEDMLIKKLINFCSTNEIHYKNAIFN